MVELDAVSFVTLVVAIVSGIGIVISLHLNRKANLLQAKSNFLNLFHQYALAHSALLKSETTIKTVQDCDIHAISYLDLLDQIAYLCLHKHINPELGFQFRVYFEYVQLMLSWYEKTMGWDDSLLPKERWNNLVLWCKINCIAPDDNPHYLPEIMQKLQLHYITEPNLQDKIKEFVPLNIKKNDLEPSEKDRWQDLKEEIGDITYAIDSKIDQNQGV